MFNLGRFVWLLINYMSFEIHADTWKRSVDDCFERAVRLATTGIRFCTLYDKGTFSNQAYLCISNHRN